MILTGLKRHAALSLLLCSFALLLGCKTTDPNPPEPYVFPTSDDSGATNSVFTARGTHSIVRVGDLLVITFSDVPNAPPRQEIHVPSTGVITLPFNVHVEAAGKTTTELEKEIREQYVPKLFVNLTVSVKPEQRVFYIDGEVKQPGRHPYYGEMTLLRAISTASGFTDFAKRSKIELRRQDGTKYVISWKKAVSDPRFDLPVFPNDYILVRRGLF